MPVSALAPGNDPDRVDDTWNVTQKREKNIQPELRTNANLEKDAQWRQQYGQDDSDKIHDFTP